MSIPYQSRWSEPLPNMDAPTARLVLDAADEPLIPRLKLLIHPPTSAGTLLDGSQRAAPISCSGSGQFSESGWQALVERLAHVKPANVVVVDLRKEAHGFLNGAAVSWFASRNWACAGLTAIESAARELAHLALLADSEKVVVTTKASVQQGIPGGTEWPVVRTFAEQALVEQTGARYVRIPVNDHCRPDDQAIRAMQELFSSLPDGSHLHFHCRGGKGRTSTALAMLDIYLHAGVDSLADIVARQYALTGYALDDRDADPPTFKTPLRRDRWRMLQEFYENQRTS
jgi:protein-tyrosine phosphatase